MISKHLTRRLFQLLVAMLIVPILLSAPTHAAEVVVFSDSEMHPDAPCSLGANRYVVELAVTTEPGGSLIYPPSVMLHFADGTTAVANIDPASSSLSLKRYMLSDSAMEYRDSPLQYASALLNTEGISPENIRFQVVEWPCLPTSSTTGTVSGVIVQHGNLRPVEGLQVCLLELNACVNTDANGRFQFADLPFSTYTVTSDGHGFRNQSITLVVDELQEHVEIIQRRGGGQ